MTVFQLSKETRQKIDRLLEAATLSKEERAVLISQLEHWIAQDLAKKAFASEQK